MIKAVNLTKVFRTESVETTALNGINLEINKGEFLAIMGPSGCGKSTLLSLICGLLPCTEGQIKINGKPLKESTTNVGYMLQHDELFEWRTIYNNVILGLEVQHALTARTKQRAHELLDIYGLGDFKNARPSELSGGMRQRAALIRTLVLEPELLLLDEPFSALDPVTRGELQNEVVKLQKRFHKTIVFVTHDMDEAIKMADRICIIQNGQIAQFDRPEEILKRPANAYVEEFVGKNRLWGNPAYIHAEDIMKKAVIHISKNRTVLQALQIMRHNTVDSLLVTSGREHRLEGIVWLKNLQEVKDYSASLEEYITQDYISVYADTSLQEIIDTVDYDASGIIPVVNHENELLGGLTKSGLLATLSKRYRRDSTEGAEE